MVAQPAIYAGFFASGPEGHAWISQHVHAMRIDMVPVAMKISLIGVRLFFRGQLDEICLHSVSELRTL